MSLNQPPRKQPKRKVDEEDDRIEKMIRERSEMNKTLEKILGKIKKSPPKPGNS